MTYECAICLNVNHVAKLHCSTCGAVPVSYSPNGVICRQVFTELDYHFIPVVVARGADRTEQHRNMRVNLRTALADYSE